MSELIQKVSPWLLDALKKHGFVGLIALVAIGLFVWGFVKIVNAVSLQIPKFGEWLSEHAVLAKTCGEEVPKIREVISNSTEAVKEATLMANQAHEATVILAREGREARDGSVVRDQEIKKTLDSIGNKVDSVESKIDDLGNAIK